MSRSKGAVGLWLVVGSLMLSNISVASAGRGDERDRRSVVDALGDWFTDKGHASWSLAQWINGLLGGNGPTSGPGGPGDIDDADLPAGAAVGTLPGKFEVDRVGNASYSVPFAVPPGANGMQPSVGLEYSSARGMGLVGVGFSLSGLSSIQRCPKTLIHDGVNQTVALERDDALCLDGQRLVWIAGGAYGTTDSEYRTRQESFRKIVARSEINELNSSFTVYSRDGKILTYGGNTTSRMYARGAVPYAWALNRIEDRFGNYLTIEYAQDYHSFDIPAEGPNLIGAPNFRYEGTSGQRPTRIRYTGTATGQPQREVTFEYVDLPLAQRIEGWRGGIFHAVSHLLTRVTMAGPTGVVRTYRLGYDDTSITQRPRLAELQLCDGRDSSAACLPPTRFDWENGLQGYEDYDEQAFDAVVFPQTQDGCFTSPKALHRLVLDANADGAQDMLIARGQYDNRNGVPDPDPLADDACNDRFFWNLWYSRGGGQSRGVNDAPWDGVGFEEHSTAIRTDFMSDRESDDNTYENLTVSVINYNGDHRDDVVYLRNRQDLDGTPNSRELVVLTSRDGGYGREILRPDNPEFVQDEDAIRQFVTPDLNGDGFQDLMICRGAVDADYGYWHFLLHSGDAENPQLSGTGTRLDATCRPDDALLVMDYDGDTAQELLVAVVEDDEPARQYRALELDFGPAGQVETVATGLPYDNFQRRSGSPCKITGGLGRDKMLDTNGDGLQDIVRSQPLTGDSTSTSPCFNLGGEIVVRVWQNMGGYFVQGPILLQGTREHLPRSFAHAVPIDYNVDGRVDLMLPRIEQIDGTIAYETWWSAIVFTPDGARYHNAFGERERLEWDATRFDGPKYRPDSMVPMGDLDGDGLHDFAFHDPDFRRWQLHRHRGARPDLLTRVTNGYGAWISVEYASTTAQAPASDLYEPGTGCSFPQSCYTGPRHVVDSYAEDTTIFGLPRQHHFKYEDGRERSGGWGWLGFRVVREVEVVEGSVTAIREREYDLDTFSEETREHPFSAIAVREQVQVPLPNTGRHWVRRTLRSPELRVRSGPALPTGAFGDVNSTYHLAVMRDSVTEEFEITGPCSEPIDDDVWGGNETELCTTQDLNSTSLLRRVRTEKTIDEHGTVDWQRVTHADGRTTIVVRDRIRNDVSRWILGLVEHEFTTDTTGSGQVQSRNWSAVYNPATGALVQHVREPTDDELVLTSIYFRDRFGNVIGTLARDGWDQLRFAANIYDAEGVFPVEHYNGLLQRSSTRWHRGLGLPYLQRDANGVSNVTEYDSFGRVLGEERQDARGRREGARVEHHYQRIGSADPSDPSPLAIVTEEAGGAVSDVEYDRLGRPVRSAKTGYFGQEVARTTTYDAQGFVEWVRERDDNGDEVTWTRMSHDNLGRPLMMSTPDNRTTTFTYDRLRSTETDPRGTSQTTLVDQHGRVSRVDRRSNSASDPRESEAVCYAYAPFDHLHYISKGCEEVAIGGTPWTVDLEPDAYGRNSRLWDTALGERLYVYDGFGNLLESVDAKLQVSQFRYDILGRMVESNDEDGVTRWRYDTSFIGALGESRSPDGHTKTYAYDTFGRPSETTLRLDNRGYVVSSRYDEFGRLSQLDYPRAPGASSTRFGLAYTYDGFGHTESVRNRGDGTAYWSALDADHRNRVVEERFGNGVVTHRTFDPHQGVLTRIQTTASSGAHVQDLTYRYDANANLLGREEQHGSMFQRESFRYDALDRLVSAEVDGTSGERIVNFSYNSAGDFGSRTDRGAYAYDELGRLERVGNVQLSYDANGNVTVRQDVNNPGAEVRFSYNAQDKLEHIETPDDTLQFEYDADDNRVVRVSEDERTTTYYVGDLFEEVVEVGQSQRPTRHYKVHANGRMVAQVTETGGNRPTREAVYIHHDHLGSANVITDASGNDVQRMAYDAWGAKRSHDWSATEPYDNLYDIRVGFTGHEERVDAGLIHMRGRMYDPAIGRFMSPDPFVAHPLNQQGWNRYAYVHNNPLRHVDPSGYKPQDNNPNYEGEMVVAAVCYEGEQCEAPEGGKRKVEVEQPAWRANAAYETSLHAVTWSSSVGGQQGAPAANQSSSAPAASWWEASAAVASDVGSAVFDALTTLDAFDAALLGAGGIAAVIDGPLPFGDVLLVGAVSHVGKRKAALAAVAAAAEVARKLVPKAARGGSARRTTAAPVGRRGQHMNVATPAGRTAANSPTRIGNRDFSGHALDRMQGQGIPPTAVESAIRPANALAGKRPGTTAYYDSANNLTVITDTATGSVVTVDYGRIAQ